MTTDAAFRPQAIRGGGKDARLNARRAQMRELWDEGMATRDAGDTKGADELFDEANDLGMSMPTDEARVCVLTGRMALGYARVPGTDWDADVPLSHGGKEPRPTALDRWTGWTEEGGQYHAPLLPAGVVTMRNDVPMLRLNAAKGSPNPGLAGVMRLLGVGDGDWVEADIARDGSVRLRRAAPGGGPRPVED